MFSLSSFLRKIAALVPQKCLDVPLVRQGKDYTCGNAAVESVLLYYGLDAQEGDLIKEQKTDSQGTEIEYMRAAFKDRGFEVFEKQMGTIEEIKKFIDQDMPVVLTLQAWPDKPEPGWEAGYSNGHYVVAIGYGDEFIVFADPSSIRMAYLTFGDLMKRWHDVGKSPDEKVIQWMLVPSGKKPMHPDKIVPME